MTTNTQKLFEDAMYEIESAVCSICAAGVPLSQIWIGKPEMQFDKQNLSRVFVVPWGVRQNRTQASFKRQANRMRRKKLNLVTG